MSPSEVLEKSKGSGQKSPIFGCTWHHHTHCGIRIIVYLLGSKCRRFLPHGFDATTPFPKSHLALLGASTMDVAFQGPRFFWGSFLGYYYHNWQFYLGDWIIWIKLLSIQWAFGNMLGSSMSLSFPHWRKHYNMGVLCGYPQGHLYHLQ